MVDFKVFKIAEFAKSNEPAILDELITLEEIRKASTKLKTGKVAGNDSLSNEMIKSSVSIIGPVLQILFNKVLNSDIFTQSVGYISPVFKASDMGDPNNYRGITVRFLSLFAFYAIFVSPYFKSRANMCNLL